MGTADGTHVPALKTLSLLFDKHGTVDTKGFPTCKQGQITNTLPAVALKTCKKALVGTGTVTAEVQFPDSKPFTGSQGPLLVFNSGPKGGDPVFIQHAYVSDPIPLRWSRSPGDQRPRQVRQGDDDPDPAAVRRLWSLTSFTAKLHKDFTYKRKKHSIFLAECANGHFFAHGDFTFTTPTTQLTSSRCTVTSSRPARRRADFKQG